MSATALHPSFAHQLLLHDGPADLADRVAPLASAAVDEGDAVLVCLADEPWRELAARLGDRSADVRHVPADDRYATPAAAMRMLHEFVVRSTDAGAPVVWSFGTIPLGGCDDADWMRYESSVDAVLGHLPLRGVCTYDARRTPSATLHAAHRCHLEVVDGAGAVASPDYAPGAHGDADPIVAPSVAPTARDTAVGAAPARDLVRRAIGDRVPAAVLEDVLLATSELVTNVHRHGQPPAVVTVWLDGARVVVDVQEEGLGVADPFFELRPPLRGRPGGAGLWVVGQVSDRVRVRRAADGSSSVVFERSIPGA
jgi:anti-sigma regulatory factor (Ser/Thr protein kinase)